MSIASRIANGVVVLGAGGVGGGSAVTVGIVSVPTDSVLILRSLQMVGGALSGNGYWRVRTADRDFSFAVQSWLEIDPPLAIRGGQDVTIEIVNTTAGIVFANTAHSFYGVLILPADYGAIGYGAPENLPPYWPKAF